MANPPPPERPDDLLELAGQFEDMSRWLRERAGHPGPTDETPADMNEWMRTREPRSKPGRATAADFVREPDPEPEPKPSVYDEDTGTATPSDHMHIWPRRD
ncbi:hypothetical protein [Streptomyces sp. UG1]|uniref:hypothetical protein n=1 Tax=Streptomyces sp. UG1 TaxID=3417652 RepID=UPI003CEFDDFE